MLADSRLNVSQRYAHVAKEANVRGGRMVWVGTDLKIIFI